MERAAIMPTLRRGMRFTPSSPPSLLESQFCSAWTSSVSAACRTEWQTGEIRHASVPKLSDRQEGQEGQETVRGRRGATPGKGLPCHPLDDHQESLWRARSRSSLRLLPGSENPEQDATGAGPRTLSGTRGSSRQGVETLSDRSH